MKNLFSLISATNGPSDIKGANECGAGLSKKVDKGIFYLLPKSTD